ncbi:2-C-methyl-D-erythritol 4-phosphate cytidylyltransferase [hydrothermal vent metagenome]|uniref:2-C-methyl-D-erythritol 4-phosphate cytidylyltransferase n=1 Tax=hydrothermal vent metagenome TaxID=652676 RepID=A0A3B0WPR3_9ZZZZ
MTNIKTNHTTWAIVPAAGIGKRMQSALPKQYILLNGRPVLEHTINSLLQNKYIAGLVIALHADDQCFTNLKIKSDKPILQTVGGNERADSVLNAINALFEHAKFDAEKDWVMVHDAVRACLRQEDIDKLVAEVAENPGGGLLALPVRDTMKRQSADGEPATVTKTVNRENLWHALTPQYFPAKSLKDALKNALDKGLAVTDDSSVMELAGFSPILVHGNEENIKITRPDDLRLASVYLKNRNSE